ncbi:MAG: hypothetical protein JRI49_04595 [Deltaproteobacteria bacterium]|nr:hypothetical protein [Deltaproteobacteria bacterium]
MGPYRTVYSEGKPLFDLDDTDYIKGQLLKRYGQGRFQVKSIGAEKPGERSQIIIHFIGDVIEVQTYERKWSKEERYKLLRKRFYPRKVKLFTIVAFGALFLLLSGLFINGIKTGMSIDMLIAVLMTIIITAIMSLFFVDHIFYETD